MSDTLKVSPDGRVVFSILDVIKPGFHVINTTIDSLVKMTPPKTDQYRTFEETRIYRIQGIIIYWTIEPDGDTHIALNQIWQA